LLIVSIVYRDQIVRLVAIERVIAGGSTIA
jgi:hypothetical protein